MKTIERLLLLSLTFPTATLVAGRTARADQVTDADPAAPTVKASPTPEARGAADDPNIDRAFLLPTAMTQPAGSITYNNYELLLHGFTYGATDHVQLSFTALAPIVKDMPFAGIGAVKWQLVSASRFHLAVQGSAGVVQSQSNDQGTVGTVGAGAFASVCLREDCSSLLSASGTYQLALGGQSDRGQLIIYGASIVHAVSPHLKLLGEITSLAGRDAESNGFDNVPGALVGYGLRFHGGNVAGDVGFLKPVLDGSDGDFVLGLPFVSVSYRWM